ncbi:MAG: ABC-F family ATP-binding cassette domain-containing protein [Spirochaetia bacterium]
MSNITATSISLAYGDRVLLDKVDMCLNGKTKAALAGVNGAGKTTLMRVLAGRQAPDTGVLTLPSDYFIGYMSQSTPVDLDASVFDQAQRAYEAGFAIEDRIAYLDQLHTPQALLDRADLHDTLVAQGFYERRAKIDATLRGLGFHPQQFDQRLGTLSSGWRMRAALAQILLSQIDFLLLDEPSNYLDMEATAWLIDWLKRYPGGYLLVSHDRYFLDQTTKETYEIFCGRIKYYQGSYSQYEVKRQQDLQTLMNQKKKQDERILEIEQFVSRFRANPSKASLVQSRIKELEKIQLIKIPENLKELAFVIPAPPPCGERVLYIENISKIYQTRPIFSDLTMLVNKGEKVVLIGENGAGKSTLMRILAGKDAEFSGFLKLGTGVKVGYFSEEVHAPLTCQTVLEEVEHSTPVSKQPEIRNLLGTFLFMGDDVHKPIAGLSGGEKARLLLLKIFLKPFNLLLLDEPTNHLDLASKDALLAALKAYTGTLVFVSHDRYFIEKLADHVLLVQQKPRYFPGDYAYAISQINKSGEVNHFLETAPKITAPLDNQLARQEKKRESAQAKKREREQNQLLEEIAEHEQKKEELKALLGQPEVYRQGERVKSVNRELAELEEKITQLYLVWEAL